MTFGHLSTFFFLISIFFQFTFLHREVIEIVYFAVSFFTGIAALYDLRTFKIPNMLNLLGVALGLSLNVLLYGIKGFEDGLIGVAIAIFGLFVFYLLHAIGAGDVKLYGAIGSFIGVHVLAIFIISMALAALYGGFITVRYCRNPLKCRTKIHMAIPIFISMLIYGVTGRI